MPVNAHPKSPLTVNGVTVRWHPKSETWVITDDGKDNAGEYLQLTDDRLDALRDILNLLRIDE